jgi:hypothetical protein
MSLATQARRRSKSLVKEKVVNRSPPVTLWCALWLTGMRAPNQFAAETFDRALDSSLTLEDPVGHIQPVLVSIQISSGHIWSRRPSPPSIRAFADASWCPGCSRKTVSSRPGRERSWPRAAGWTSGACRRYYTAILREWPRDLQHCGWPNRVTSFVPACTARCR